jgi:hypothetical protein
MRSMWITLAVGETYTRIDGALSDNSQALQSENLWLDWFNLKD